MADGSDWWSQVLQLLTRIIVPDWGSLVGLIPLVVAVPIVAVLVGLAVSWWRLARRQLTRQRRLGLAPRGPLARLAGLPAPLALVPVGVLVAALGLVLPPSAAEVVNLPVLVGGLGLALVGVGLTVEAVEAADGGVPRSPSDARVPASALPGASTHQANGNGRPMADRLVRRIPWLAGAAVLVVASFAFSGPSVGPGAVNLPVLVAGLVVALAVAADAVRQWEGDDEGRGRRPGGRPDSLVG